MGELNPSQQMMSSCVGAVITSLFMTPFDVIKVRIQAQQRAQLERTCFLYCNGLMDHICKCASNIYTPHENGPWYNRPVPVHLNGTLDAFVKISKQEGIQTLWSGLPPTLVVAVPNTVLYFTTYEQLRTKFHKWLPGEEGGPPSWAGGLAGGLARMWSVTLVSPFELVRTKMQSKNMSYREVGNVLQTQLAKEGVLSLWRGWVPTILRDVPFSVLYWYTYEKMKRVMKQEYPTFSFTLYAGAISGGIAGAVTLPLDVIKTHRQIDIGEKAIFSDSAKNIDSTKALLQKIYRQQGIRGLFAGLVPRLAKVMPACAIMISTYEYAKRLLRLRKAKVVET